MKLRLGLLLAGGLLPGWAAAQMSADTCCRPVGVGYRPARLPGQPAPPVALPTCYAPVLAVPDPLPYDPSQPALPVFRWKSGAPIYATDEQFFFQLVALPSKQILLERKTPSHQVEWPPSLRLPEATTQLTYSLQATRRDLAGQQCYSTTIQGTVQVARKTAAPNK